MIVDLDKFLVTERPHWTELQHLLDRLEAEPAHMMSLEELSRFHYLYRRTSADLAKLTTFASEPALRGYLESLVARAYGEIHESRERRTDRRLRHWFFVAFPATFRRHIRAFQFATALMFAGCLFGGFALALDPAAKPVIMPFAHLLGDPSERVRKEEQAAGDGLVGAKGTFSATLMTHNTKVAIFTLALGMTWGIGTITSLFYNGVILGAVAADYLFAGQAAFLFGWLLPHGAVEIPAILIAGQAGLVLANALIGWQTRVPLKSRLRQIAPDLTTLILGVALLLVWAGIVEAFFSQYHEPIVPYSVKIAFGVVEIVLLFAFLAGFRTSRNAHVGTSA